MNASEIPSDPMMARCRLYRSIQHWRLLRTTWEPRQSASLALGVNDKATQYAFLPLVGETPEKRRAGVAICQFPKGSRLENMRPLMSSCNVHRQVF
jgi:hypothetical protein